MTDWKYSVASVWNCSRMTFVWFTVYCTNGCICIWVYVFHAVGILYQTSHWVRIFHSHPPWPCSILMRGLKFVLRCIILVREIALPSPPDGFIEFYAPKTGALETANDIRFEREQELTKQVSTFVSRLIPCLVIYFIYSDKSSEQLDCNACCTRKLTWPIPNPAYPIVISDCVPLNPHVGIFGLLALFGLHLV